MHITIQQNKLVQAVNDVMKAVSSKTTISILTGIKMVATEEGVILTGSDSDISIKSFIPKEEENVENIQIKKTGGIVLQAKIFSELVKKLPKEAVDIEVFDNFSTRVVSGNTEFDLLGLDPEEYPQLPQIKEHQTFQMPTRLLKQIIHQTVFAVSTNETRPVLTGVNWHFENGKLICVATDSHRLAMRKTPIESGDFPTVSNIIIPGKSLNELYKILEDTDDLVDISITDNQILFKTKNLLFFSRLLDGNYPDTSRLIPTEYKTEVTLVTKEFLQTIDRASLLAREAKNNVVKMTTLEDRFIQISTFLPEIGKIEEVIQCQKVVGEDLKISFSAKYMMDALKALDSTDIKIGFTGSMRPFIIRPLQDDSILQLILPVRTY